jgi:hypothetical protein
MRDEDLIATFVDDDGDEIEVYKIRYNTGALGAAVTLSTLGMIDADEQYYEVRWGSRRRRFEDEDDAIDFARELGRG